MTPNVVGFIFARGGSKGVPGKNIRPLGGKPLIAHAICSALQSRFISRVIVSTDDEQIAAAAADWGAEAPFLRPAELSTDRAPEWLAWRHAVEFHENSTEHEPLDVFVSVPTTAPLRDPGDIDRCVEAYLGGGVEMVITVTPARRSPYFNMVVLDENQQARLAAGQSAVCRRQDCPPAYDMTTVAYVASPSFILRSQSIFEGRVKAVVVPEQRALDIDSELDFEIAEYLFQRRTRDRGGEIAIESPEAEGRRNAG